MNTLDPFYPIFDSSDWVTRLVPIGIKLMQLRIKDKADEALRSEIKKSKSVCDANHCQLIVNDYWQLAIDLGCDFIHLGQEDLDDADIDAIRASGIRIGISTHSETELERALKLSPDYIALGPVYPTILKKMPWDPQGLERVSQWKNRIGDIPLVGIGGLNLDRARGVLDAGADVVSLVTDITLNSDPETQVAKWLDVTRPYRGANADGASTLTG
ncbi:MAG: thiamine phosphate synthase [Pseudomonadota bacterium]